MEKVSNATKMKVAILYISTGRYHVFWPGFYKTLVKYFLPQAEVERKIYVFTDQDFSYFKKLEHPGVPVVCKHIENEPWPGITLKRYHIFNKYENEWCDCDYLFFINSDYEFKKVIAPQDILPTNEESGLVIADHTCSLTDKPDDFPYERNPKSRAYIPFGKGEHYLAGGLNGGTRDAFMKMSHAIAAAVDEDLEKGIVAKWHDESHINAYALDKKVKILSIWYLIPSYEVTRKNKAQVIAGPRDKLEYGGHAWLRYETDKKRMPKTLRKKLRILCWIILGMAILSAVAYNVL